MLARFRAGQEGAFQSGVALLDLVEFDTVHFFGVTLIYYCVEMKEHCPNPRVTKRELINRQKFLGWVTLS